VWFPLLPADRIIRQRKDARDKPPLVAVEKQKGAMRIGALSREAKRAGLVVGLTLADARARIPDLWVEEIDRRADADLLDAVADDCGRVTPIVMTDAPDGLTLDITGCEHLFGGEAQLRLGMSQRLRRAGLHSAELIAGAPDTAIVEDVQRPPTGVLQARVRLRMAAAMSRGRHADASDAARQLADMQAKAGRRVAARIWSEQARRIETKTVRP